jgi:hypothetical protein
MTLAAVVGEWQAVCARKFHALGPVEMGRDVLRVASSRAVTMSYDKGGNPKR